MDGAVAWDEVLEECCGGEGCEWVADGVGTV